MLKLQITIPQNQWILRELLEKSGYTAIFEPGHPEPDESRRPELNRGIIHETGDSIIQLRSMDVLKQVASGYQDVGFVGSDCIDEWPAWKVVKLSEFPFGRAIGYQQPRLEVVVSPQSKIKSIRDIKIGNIFLSERPNLTAQFLRNLGFDVVVEQEEENPKEFSEMLARGRKVGIRIILGSGIPQLKSEGQLLVMVNEKGTTADEYGVRVIAKICDITTVLIADQDALEEEAKRERILRLRNDIEGIYRAIEAELPRGAEFNLSRTGNETPGEPKPLGRNL